MKRLVLALLLITPYFAWAGFGDPEPFTFMDGDIVFQESKSRQSRAIKKATGSRYTHIGLVVMQKGRPHVLEAVNPVRIIPFSRWRKNGVDGHVIVKRLSDRSLIEGKTNQKRMHAIGRSHLGKPYDSVFAWDQRQMYCSELVYRVYFDGAGIALGEVERFADMDLSSPVVKRLIKRRLGKRLDPLEPVVTPVSIFEDAKLSTVATF